MNRLLSDEWLSGLGLDQADRWLTLATIAASGEHLDLEDLAIDPVFANLGNVLGLPVVDGEKVEAEWRSQGRVMDSPPSSGDWTVLLARGSGNAILVPEEANQRTRLMLFTRPDERDGLRVAVLEVEERVVTAVEVRRRHCRQDPDTGVCSGQCRRGGTCDWQFYAGGGPVTGKCKCLR